MLFCSCSTLVIGTWDLDTLGFKEASNGLVAVALLFTNERHAELIQVGGSGIRVVGCRGELVIAQFAVVGLEVVVAIVAVGVYTLAGVEMELLDLDEFHRSTLSFGSSCIPRKFELFLGTNLGTIGSSHDSHILCEGAHWRSRHVSYIASLIHVIIHAYIEEIIPLVDVGHVVIVIRPGEAVTMDGAFEVFILTRSSKDREARIDVLDAMSTVMVNIA